MQIDEPLTDVELVPGRIIAEFSCGHDARLFASLKRDAGDLVTITVGINYVYAVRTLVPVDAAFRAGLKAVHS